MSPYITLSHQNNIYFLEKLIKIPKFRMCIFLILILFLIYFFQIISLNSSGYSINKIENQTQSLKINIQNLEGQLANLQRPQYLGDLAEKLNLVETKSIVYINIVESNVAVRP